MKPEDKSPQPSDGQTKPISELSAPQMDINSLPGNPPPEPEKNSRWGSIISTIFLFALAPLTALAIAAFVIQSYQVDGQSMETTLQNNDRLIVNKIPRSLARLTHHSYVPPRGTIIIFNEQLDLGTGLSEKQLVKRVIGLPGERVVVNNGTITIYNKQHPEGFNPDTSGQWTLHLPGGTPLTTPGQVDVTLTSNQLFVSGDNRLNSEDSRYFGPIELSQVVGKLSFRILPISEIHHY